MKGMDVFNNAAKGLIDLFFPRKCPFCGAITEKDGSCRRCETTLHRFEGVRKGVGFGRVTAPLWYEGSVREAILAFKFRAKLGGLETFGSLLAQCAAERYSGEFDAITWVPVSAKRLRKRGYDQARYLAAAACVDWHTAPQETLKKVADNPAQSSLEDRKLRRDNVRGVYESVRPEEIAGKRFLLIDDIFTTGATMGECVQVLKRAGAADVVCLALAITPGEKGINDGE